MNVFGSVIPPATGLSGSYDAGEVFAATSASNLHGQSRLLKKVLKQQIRLRGLRYQDIAEKLGISVMTVKRHLNSDRVPIETLEDIADCMGLGLIDLAELAKTEGSDGKLDLEYQQERTLASDYPLALVRLLLYGGMSVQEIMEEYELDETTIIRLLTRLDRLKLIELFPGNRVRIRGPRVIEWRPGGPMRHEIERDIRNSFMDLDFANTEEFFGYETAYLSPNSIQQVEEQMRQLVRTIRLLHEIDRNNASERKQWVSVLTAKRPSVWAFPMPDGELRMPRSSRETSNDK